MNRYKIKITGKSLGYFLDLLIRKKVNFYYLEQTKDFIIIIIDDNDYKQIKKIKTTNKITILNRYGLPKVFYILEKYKYLLGSFLVTLIGLIFLSNMIFEVEVVHTKEEIRNIIYEDLKKLGIEKYKFKKTYDKKEQIKKMILNEEKEKIEWLEIENIGTKYIINVEERKKNTENNEQNPQDIIAKKDALIIEISADYGEVQKKKNDYVKKGETIISGIIKNKEEPVAKVRAAGKVYGEIWYKASVELPKHYYEEKFTKNEKKTLRIQFFNKEINLFNLKKYKNYKIDEFVLIRNNYLPMKLTLDTQKELEIIEETYTFENCDKKALEVAEESLKRKLSEGSEIISKKILKKQNKNSKIIIEVFFKVKEDITATKDISILDITQEE